MKSKFSLRAVSHEEPWKILSRVGAMVTSLLHRGKLEGRGWARLSTRVGKTHRLSEESVACPLEVC